jgi:hypothetical protein
MVVDVEAAVAGHARSTDEAPGGNTLREETSES